MKNMIKLLSILFCITVLSSTNVYAAATSTNDRCYWERWAAVPYKHCPSTKHKLEAVKARALAKSYPEEKKVEIQQKLAANEQKESMVLPPLKNPDAPISPRDAAILNMLSKK